MRIFVRLLCSFLALAICAGCSSPSREKRPYVYRGGQYYGDALHAQDLTKREDHPRQDMRN